MQGCKACRDSWAGFGGYDLPLIDENIEEHTRLKQCKACGTFWQEDERYPNALTAEEAKAYRARAAKL